MAVSRYSGLTPKNREFKIQIMTDSFYDLTTTEKYLACQLYFNNFRIRLLQWTQCSLSLRLWHWCVRSEFPGASFRGEPHWQPLSTIQERPDLCKKCKDYEDIFKLYSSDRGLQSAGEHQPLQEDITLHSRCHRQISEPLSQSNSTAYVSHLW